jgi:hypothetical protein
MSYFIINNVNNINNTNKHNQNVDYMNSLDLRDIQFYMSFMNNNYNITKKNVYLEELIEIFNQLNIDYKSKHIFFNHGVSKMIRTKFNVLDNKKKDILICNKPDYTIKNNIKFILQINNILNNEYIKYIYNLLLMYGEIIIYNCYITQINSFRIYVICLNDTEKEELSYNNCSNIPQLFVSNIKNIYYQIIHNRFNIIKKGNQDRESIWNTMYLTK